MVDSKIELYSFLESLIKDHFNEKGAEQINVTPELITAFTNLLSSQIKINAIDLEYFAKHAKRMTINLDDVKLLARRNESLENNLSEFINNNIKKE